MLIIEGSDCVGKTRLAKRLEKELGLTYQHLSRLPDKFDRYHGYIDLMSQYIVRDRFHMSEVVYARMRSEETMLTPERYRLVDAQLRMLGCVTVVIIADDPLIGERYRARAEQEMYRLDQTLQVNDLFTAFVESSDPFMLYQPDVDIVIDCHSKHPFPDDDDVHAILTQWHSRQGQLFVTTQNHLGYHGKYHV